MVIMQTKIKATITVYYNSDISNNINNTTNNNGYSVNKECE